VPTFSSLFSANLHRFRIFLTKQLKQCGKTIVE
jgi:hypothetical protein